MVPNPYRSAIMIRPAQSRLRRAWDRFTVWLPMFGYRAEYRRLAMAEEYWRLASRWGWARVAQHTHQLKGAVRIRIKKGLV